MALTAAAAHDGHLAAVDADSDALVAALLTLPTQRPGDAAADQERQYTILDGLIAEFDPLLAAGLDDPRFFAKSRQLIDYVALTADADSRPSLRARAWRPWLMAANWPVDARPREKPDPTDLVDLPALPPSLLALAEESLAYGSTDLVLAGTLIITLWANAVAVARRRDYTIAGRLYDMVASRRADLDDMLQILQTEAPDVAELRLPLPDKQFLSLCDAVLAWAHAATNGDNWREVQIPASEHEPITVASTNRRYHGLRPPGREPLVVVEEHDGSRRILPAIEAKGDHSGFEWGYGGGGPMALARALVKDALNDSIHCPDCFGAAPLTAWLITCDNCRNTGYAVELGPMAFRLESRIISELPSSRDGHIPAGSVEWTVAQQQVLDAATARSWRPQPN